MIGNVQILNNNGDLLISNGLARFIVNDSQKQYIIYTLGEQTNGALKIYIGLENAPVTDEGITETDGDLLTELLKKIGKNEDVSSLVTFLPLEANLYHINDRVKKVAVPTKVFNNVIDIQQRSRIKSVQEDGSIIDERAFSESSSMEEQKKEELVQQESSIFSQPMQPIAENASEIQGSNELQVEIIEEDNNQLESNGALSIGSELGNEDLITEEQAENAIKVVENAQKEINQNIKLIRLYINQQKALANQLIVEINKDNSQLTPKEDTSAYVSTTESEKIIQEPDKSDVIRDIELAPQPEEYYDVLEEETNLSNNSVLDTTVQTSADVNLESSFDRSVDMPEQQIEYTPGYIDTTAMVQQPSTLETQTGENMGISTPQIIDTQAMVPSAEVGITEKVFKPVEVVFDSALDQASKQDKVIGEQQNIGFATQMPIPEFQNTNQQPVREESTGVLTTPSSDINQSEYEEVVIPFPTPGEQMIDTGENYSISSADIENAGGQVPEIAPVVIPDGQTSEIERSLVLTPDAFNQAA